ncbi:nucleotidyltransferase [Mesorhizobium erdmanii]|uniref:nucleotidyltransferase n=1 Tax=Mesorhizobium erdmanii TaxID=1777866 RepID=UPI000AC07D3E|nr:MULTISPECIES: nucleotidyltransferase [Mesorhizobium]
MSDAYLQGILAREAVDTGLYSPVRSVQATLTPVISGWAGNKLLSVNPSGSFAKGTANHSGTDIDLFISLSEDTAETLQQIYELLFKKLTAVGYAPKRQNVSINIQVNGYDVDLVPAKRQNSLSSDHSLYRRRANTWTKTNVQTHIATVWAGGRQQESRLIKLWRDQKGLDFPSFYVKKLTAVGYAPKRQNVSINIQVNGYDVDLVPAKRQNSLSSDHSLYRRRANTWTKTNVQTHIATVWAGGRQQESRLIKLWRDQKGLDFPSFYVELAVIEALRNTNHATLSERVLACLIYLRDRLPNARFVDPANTNNVISDDLTPAEKQRISAAAAQAINGTWGQFVK